MTSETVDQAGISVLGGLTVVTVSAMVTFLLFDAGLFEPNYDHVQNAVAAELRDPSSAQFRKMTGSDDTVCGEVNGKNAFGAYAGFQKFVYRRGAVFMEPEIPPMGSTAELSRHYEDVARFERFSVDCLN